MIASYRMSVGDFDIIDTFEDNSHKVTFWLIFIVGNLVSLLIILNMVIAVMSESFASVQENIDANIYKMKVENLIENSHRLTKEDREEIEKHKYLVLIAVETYKEVDEDQKSENRIRKDIGVLTKRFEKTEKDLSRISLNAEILLGRMQDFLSKK